MEPTRISVPRGALDLGLRRGLWVAAAGLIAIGPLLLGLWALDLVRTRALVDGVVWALAVGLIAGVGRGAEGLLARPGLAPPGLARHALAAGLAFGAVVGGDAAARGQAYYSTRFLDQRYASREALVARAAERALDPRRLAIAAAWGVPFAVIVLLRGRGRDLPRQLLGGGLGAAGVTGLLVAAAVLTSLGRVPPQVVRLALQLGLCAFGGAALAMPLWLLDHAERLWAQVRRPPSLAPSGPPGLPSPGADP